MVNICFIHIGVSGFKLTRHLFNVDPNHLTLQEVQKIATIIAWIDLFLSTLSKIPITPNTITALSEDSNAIAYYITNDFYSIVNPFFERSKTLSNAFSSMMVRILLFKIGTPKLRQ